MSNINTVVVSGRLTRDPELRHIGDDLAVCEIGLANNRSKKTDNGYEDVVSYFDVTIYAGRGETVARKISKGDFVIVKGRLEQRRWEDKETGANRSKVSIVAETIEGEGFLRSRDEDRDLAEVTAGAGEAPAGSAQGDDIPF